MIEDVVVVRNGEDQHAIWPAHLPLPPGWTQLGNPEPRDLALRRVAELWPDITPRSIRA